VAYCWLLELVLFDEVEVDHAGAGREGRAVYTALQHAATAPTYAAAPVAAIFIKRLVIMLYCNLFELLHEVDTPRGVMCVLCVCCNSTTPQPPHTARATSVRHTYL